MKAAILTVSEQGAYWSQAPYHANQTACCVAVLGYRETDDGQWVELYIPQESGELSKLTTPVWITQVSSRQHFSWRQASVREVNLKDTIRRFARKCELLLMNRIYEFGRQTYRGRISIKTDRVLLPEAIAHNEIWLELLRLDDLAARKCRASHCFTTVRIPNYRVTGRVVEPQLSATLGQIATHLLHLYIIPTFKRRA